MTSPIMIQVYYGDSKKPDETILIDTDSGITTIGRKSSSKEVTLKLDPNDRSISREHLSLKINGRGRWEIESLTDSSLSEVNYVKDEDISKPSIVLKNSKGFELPTYGRDQDVFCDVIVGKKNCRLSIKPQTTLYETEIETIANISTLTINGKPLISTVSNRANSPKILKLLFDKNPVKVPTEIIGELIDPNPNVSKSSKRDNTKKSIQLLRGDLKEINDLGDEKIEIKNDRNAGYYIEIIGKEI